MQSSRCEGKKCLPALPKCRAADAGEGGRRSTCCCPICYTPLMAYVSGERGARAVREGEGNNCRCFGKKRDLSRVAPRVQPLPPIRLARACVARNCQLEH